MLCPDPDYPLHDGFIMPTYIETLDAIARQTKLREDALPVMNQDCRSRYWFQPQPTPKVCLFFHGFTAGPFQFMPMGEAFADAGYNVLAPLQPGHGIAGNWNGDQPPPLPTDIRVYQDFALYWLDQAQALGEQVVVGGLSSGATLAAWLAMEYPERVARTLLFAPYLSGNNRIVDFLVETLPFYYEWPNSKDPGHGGYKGFEMPALRIFLDLAQALIDRAPTQQSAPMFFVLSDSDLSTNEHDQRSLFEGVLQHQPKSWYHCLDRAFRIPHTMMTKAEGNPYQDLLSTLAKAFVESDLTWTEVLQIGNCILHGKTFEAAIADLNLSDRAAPELSVLLTLIEPKTFIKAIQTPD